MRGKNNIFTAFFIILAGCSGSALASEIFAYPDSIPKINTTPPPSWLSAGKGDDGYVTIRAEITQDSSCKSLRDGEGLLRIRREEMQVVASLTSSGFNNNLDTVEIPLATFDGRNSTEDCAILSTLPLTIVPFARLESFSDTNPGDQTILVNIKSTTESKSTLLSGAQLMLGAGAIFATGGAAATVSGVTTVLAQPALKELQRSAEKALSGTMPGQSRISLSWASLRNGVRTYTIPVYLGKSDFLESKSDALSRLQKNKDGEKIKLFDVRLTFSYSRTLFDARVTSPNEFRVSDSIASREVLSYPRSKSSANLFQLLNRDTPNLLQDLADPKLTADLPRNCGKVLQIMKEAGLNLTDRTIVLKSFIDEAMKGPSWYTPANFKRCFRDYPEAAEVAISIYGPPDVSHFFSPEVSDIADGVGVDYEKWKSRVTPVLSSFRRAMEVNDDRISALLSLNGNADIRVDLISDAAEWQDESHSTPAAAAGIPIGEPSSGNGSGSYPGLLRLSSKKIKEAGCFVYDSRTDYDSDTPGGSLILVGNDDDFWTANVLLSQRGPGRIERVTIFRMDQNWKNFFSSNSYSGTKCQSIISRMR